MPTYQQLVQGKVPEPFWQLRNMKRAGYTYCGYVGFSELLIEHTKIPEFQISLSKLFVAQLQFKTC